MTPEQKLKHAILLKAHEMDCICLPEGLAINADNVDDLYEKSDEGWELQDARNEIRCSGEKTNIPAPSSRHYESDSVAAKMPDGSWVGWTYWYGGGKHGEPEAVEWINEAYALSCEEKRVTVTRRKFTKP